MSGWDQSHSADRSVIAEHAGTVSRPARRRRPRISLVPGYVETTTSASASAAMRNTIRPVSTVASQPMKRLIGAHWTSTRYSRSNHQLSQRR